MDLNARIEKSRRKFVVNTVICGILSLTGVAILFLSKFVICNEIAMVFAIFIAAIFFVIGTLVYFVGIIEKNSLIYPRTYEAKFISRKYYDKYKIDNHEKVNVIVYEFEIIYSGEVINIIETDVIDDDEKYSVLGSGSDTAILYSYRKINESRYDIKNHSEFEALIKVKYGKN